MMKPGAPTHFAILDSLRGGLALWVLAGHIGEFSAYSVADSPGWLHLILRPSLAVDVFMLLSGFVIARLITQKREPYLPYIVRRAFRLAPAFVVVLTFSVLTLPLVHSTLGWHAAQMNQDEARSYASLTQHFWTHLLFGLPLLQGLVPQNLLPSSAFGFLTPAWSISLEWQFYLVAPLLVWLLRRDYVVLALMLALGVLGSPWLENFYPVHSILPTKLSLFTLGILSWWFFNTLGRQVADLPVALAVAAVALAPTGITGTIWLATLALLFSQPAMPLLGQLHRIATHPALVGLGNLSFSLYLVHYPLLRVLKAWALAINPERSRESLALFLLVTGLPASLAAAFALYRLVETPGIALGKKLALACSGADKTKKSQPLPRYEKSPIRPRNRPYQTQ